MKLNYEYRKTAIILLEKILRMVDDGHPVVTTSCRKGDVMLTMIAVKVVNSNGSGQV